MDENIIYCGNVESRVTFQANQEIHFIVWTVPNCMDFFDKLEPSQVIQPVEQKILHSNPTGTSSEDNFQLNIELKTDYPADYRHTKSVKLIDIGYKSKTPAFLRYCKLKMFTYNLSTWAYSEEEQTIFLKERGLVGMNNFKSIGCLWMRVAYNEKLGFEVDGKPDIVCLLSENSLRLNLEFAVASKTLVCNIPASQLSEDWEKLFHEGLYSDAVIKSTEGEEFKVHKVVLASRCAVLKAHFEHNTTETTTNIVKTNLKSAVLQEVLSFIYTDRAEVDKDPETLLAAADYYQLSRLKSLCEDSLRKKLSVNNALEILQLADLLNANTLKNITQEFMKRNGVQQK